jgi:hypothetical protein
MIAVMLAGVAASVLTPAAQAKSRAFVAKPSKIACVASHLGERAATVRCDLPFIGHKAVFLHTRAKAEIKRVSDFLHAGHRSTLGSGQEARFGAFTCKSLPAAVTCRSTNGHGFTVGKKFQLTF